VALLNDDVNNHIQMTRNLDQLDHSQSRDNNPFLITPMQRETEILTDISETIPDLTNNATTHYRY
jgi:hypothetical protein